MTKQGITVQCISCKARKTLSLDEASAIRTVPFCNCGMPMVVVSAHVKRPRR